MGLSIVSLVISLFSLGISAAVAFGIAEQVKRRYIGPKLAVDFKGIAGVSGPGVDSYHVRVPISNGAGRLSASLTEIYVEYIRVSAMHSLDPTKRSETIPGYVPMRFQWCHGAGASQNIPSGEHRLFDLCEIVRHPVSNAHKCLFRGEVVPANGSYEIALNGQMFEVSLSISTESGRTVKQRLLLNPRFGDPPSAEVTPLG